MKNGIALFIYACICFLYGKLSAKEINFQPLGTPKIETQILFDDEENTAEEIALGKQLFFDKRLSINHQQSCASCHAPNKGFGDDLITGVGTKNNPLKRNTPHLYNLGWSSIFMWDGREASLESQALGPIHSKDEMMLPIPTLIQRLKAVKGYQNAFKEAYGEDSITPENIARALAAFERMIIVDDTPFDRYIAGDTAAMSASAINGLALFKEKAKCVACHDGVNFTDDSFHSLGFEDGDLGRMAVLNDPSFRGAFKTPGLRNTALTAPYMHHGSLESLQEVVQFYNAGGGPAEHKSNLITELRLSDKEVEDLTNFLMALTQPINIQPPKIRF